MHAIGLDFGERRIGVASGDTDSSLAVPVGAIDRTALDADIGAIIAMAEERGVGMLVVGLPLSMSGKPGPQAERTEAFVVALRERTSLEVETIDERLTSVEAERRIRDVPRGRRSSRERVAKGAIDAAAAAVILQAWLDRRRAVGG